MLIKKFSDPQTLYTTLVDDFLKFAKSLDMPRVGLPTGKTVVEFYQGLSARKTEIKDWCTFPLDEYVGLEELHPDSFSHTLNQQFYSWASPYIKRRYSWQRDQPAIVRALATHPLDCALLGVGINGHVAFNEPGSKSTDSIREVTLQRGTRERNFGERASTAPTAAITLGINELLQTRKIFVVATGESKRAIITQAFLTRSGDIPLSLLLDHPDITFYFDQEAAPDGAASHI